MTSAERINPAGDTFTPPEGHPIRGTMNQSFAVTEKERVTLRFVLKWYGLCLAASWVGVAIGYALFS